MDDVKTELVNKNQYLDVEEEKLTTPVSLEITVDNMAPTFLPSIPRAMMKLMGIALPIAGSFTFSLGVVFIAILAGQLPAENATSLELRSAATTLVSSVVNVTGGIGIAWLVILGLLVSKSFGRYKRLQNEATGSAVSAEHTVMLAGEIETIDAYNKNGLLLGFVGVFPSMIALLNSEFLLVNVLKQDKTIAKIASSYLRVYAFAMPGLGLRSSIEEFLLACRHEKAAAILGQIQLVIGLSLGYFLSAVKGMGLRGIALGFLIEAYATMISYGLYITFHPAFRAFKFFRHWRMNCQRDCRQIQRILMLGFPMLFALSNELIAQLVMKSFLGRVSTPALNTAALAADNFTGLLLLFAVLPNFAISVAATQQFSRDIGAGRPRHAMRYVVSGIATITVFLVPIGVIISSYPELLVALIDKDMKDPEVLRFIRGFAPINSINMLFDGIGFTNFQVLCAIDDKFWPPIFSMSSVWSGVLIGALLGFNTKLGPYGVLLGYTLGLFGRMMTLGIRCYRLLDDDRLQQLIHESEASVSLVKDACKTSEKKHRAESKAPLSLFFCCNKTKTLEQDELLSDVHNTESLGGTFTPFPKLLDSVPT